MMKRFGVVVGCCSSGVLGSQVTLLSKNRGNLIAEVISEVAEVISDEVNDLQKSVEKVAEVVGETKAGEYIKEVATNLKHHAADGNRPRLGEP
jgi:hypothetical protein